MAMNNFFPQQNCLVRPDACHRGTWFMQSAVTALTLNLGKPPLLPSPAAT